MEEQWKAPKQKKINQPSQLEESFHLICTWISEDIYFIFGHGRLSLFIQLLADHHIWNNTFNCQRVTASWQVFLKDGVLNTSIFVIEQSWHVYIHHIFLYCAVRTLINCETSIDSNYSLISKDVEMTIPKQGSDLHSCSITGMKYVKNCPSSKYLGITYFNNTYSQLETYIHF